MPLGERPAELRASYRSLGKVLEPVKCADLDLVLDARQAVGRNDAAFEAAQAEFRARVVGRFRACVAVVGSLDEAAEVIRSDRFRGRMG